MEVDKIPQRKRVKVPVPKVSEVLTASAPDVETEEQQKAKKALALAEKMTAVVKFMDFPRGFYGKEQLGYFSQFGKVKRVRMVCNKRSARPSGISFVEFDDRGVAEIVCETMNGYLMFEKVIKAKQLRRKDLPKCMLKKGGARLPPPPKRYANSRKHARLANADKSAEKVKKAQGILQKKLAKKNEEFEKSGIKYKFEFGAKKTEASD
uniref:RRM domain-containing protein n=1 Tax=Steinernema glaseri TaxID=37863 RepID=A0A1I7Y461_9BILA